MRRKRISRRGSGLGSSVRIHSCLYPEKCLRIGVRSGRQRPAGWRLGRERVDDHLIGSAGQCSCVNRAEDELSVEAIEERDDKAGHHDRIGVSPDFSFTLAAYDEVAHRSQHACVACFDHGRKLPVTGGFCADFQMQAGRFDQGGIARKKPGDMLQPFPHRRRLVACPVSRGMSGVVRLVDHRTAIE